MSWQQIFAIIAGALAILALLAFGEPVVLLAVAILLLAVTHLAPS